MAAREETEAYLNAVERFTGRRFRQRWAAATLIDCADAGAGLADFERIVFLAKFITSAFDILRRSGAASEDTRHLVRELNTNLEEVSSRLGKVADASPDEGRRIRERFLSLTQPSMESLRELLAELTWIKQYMLEGNAPPIRAAGPL